VNLAQIIDGHDPARPALVSRGRVTTYGALREQVDRCRAGFAAAGVVDGDRVALLCSNGRHFVVAYLAALGLGAVAVPLNPTSPGPEVERELATVGAVAAIVDAIGIQAWRHVDRAAVPSVRHVWVTEAGAQSTDGHRSLDDLIAAEVPAVPVADVDPDHLAALLFTSGTAGAPRAAMLSHGNLRSNIDQGQSAEVAIGPDDVVYGVLPVFHIFGLNVMLGLSLARGASIVLVQRFDPSTALDTIRDRGVTVVPGAPPLWVAFSHFDDAPGDAFATVRLALTGAAKMPEEAQRRLQERFGVTLAEGYGLTEASPVVTSSAGVTVKIGSVGRVLAGMDVRLVDEAGDDVLQGDAGEVWVKGPNVFLGYLDEPEQTARVLTPDGWLRTGDIATVDEDGYLYLVDRAKDLIIVSGFNVYPAEVEEVLGEHPGVAEVGVVGVPHPHHGEAVKAFVVPAGDAHLDEEQLIAWCADRLARYKCPSKILFVDQLPRNVSGKLLRRSLV
jgi:long-chain acyl-CoA synthetase